MKILSGRIELKDDSNKNHDSGTGHDNCPFYPESSRYKQIIELLSQSKLLLLVSVWIK